MMQSCSRIKKKETGKECMIPLTYYFKLSLSRYFQIKKSPTKSKYSGKRSFTQ